MEKEKTNNIEETVKDITKMNIYQKLQNCRVELQNKELNKSGENKFANFKYFELKDFLPTINELFSQYGLFSQFNIQEEIATLIITDGEKEILFTSPIAEANVKGCTPIQSLGAVHTYMKRYLYLNALEIVENDMLDSQVGKMEVEKENKKETKEIKATESQVKMLKEKLNEEQIKKALEMVKREKLEDLTVQEASSLIKRIGE